MYHVSIRLYSLIKMAKPVKKETKKVEMADTQSPANEQEAKAPKERQLRPMWWIMMQTFSFAITTYMFLYTVLFGIVYFALTHGYTVYDILAYVHISKDDVEIIDFHPIALTSFILSQKAFNIIRISLT
eukprot:Ihof_evm3s636 gene=Ihof_evmTU3s636